MKRSKHKSYSIFLVAILGTIFLGGCLDDISIGSCPPPEDDITRRVYSVSLDGEIEAIEPDWKYHIGGSGDNVKMHGIDSLRNYIYFSDDNSYGIIRVNYKTKEQSFYQIEGNRFNLSPEGTRLIYENTMGFNNSVIKIAQLFDTSNNWIPSDTSFQHSGVRMPIWESDEKISFLSNEGIFFINQHDSTLNLISNRRPSNGYDISLENESVIFSDRDDSSYQSDDAMVFYKEGFDNDFVFLTRGVFPMFIPNKNKFLYETSSELYISDFNGNTKTLYKKPDSYYYNSSGKKRIAMSPDGSNLVITTSDGVYLMDIDSNEIKKLVGTEYFVPDNWESPSNTSSFVAPIFSPDGTKIFFSITLNEVDFSC